MEIKNLSEFRRFLPDKMAKNNLFETPRFFVDLYCLEPGQSQDLHQHTDHDKVYIVHQGRGRFEVGSDQAELEAGQAVLAPSGVAHGVFNDGPERLVVLTFMAPHPRLARTGAAGAGKRADAPSAGNPTQDRLEQLSLAFDQFSVSFERIWSVIARGEAGNLVAEALEDPTELERAQRLRGELETALRRLNEVAGT